MSDHKKPTMITRFGKTDSHNGKNLGQEKEQTSSYTLVCHKGGEFTQPLTIRCWMGRSSQASVVYASVWLHCSNTPIASLTKAAQIKRQAALENHPDHDAFAPPAKTFYLSLAGHGQAGGCGYHKESAAIQAALTSAGIELFGTAYTSLYLDSSIDPKTYYKELLKKSCSISGVGSTAIEVAMLAIGRALGFADNQMTIVRG